MGALGSLVLALTMTSSADKGDLTRPSIDELASLKVVTVSRRPEARIEAVIGQNLLHRHHADVVGGFEVDRAFRARATVDW